MKKSGIFLFLTIIFSLTAWTLSETEASYGVYRASTIKVKSSGFFTNLSLRNTFEITPLEYIQNNNNILAKFNSVEEYYNHSETSTSEIYYILNKGRWGIANLKAYIKIIGLYPGYEDNYRFIRNYKLCSKNKNCNKDKSVINFVKTNSIRPRFKDIEITAPFFAVNRNTRYSARLLMGERKRQFAQFDKIYAVTITPELLTTYLSNYFNSKTSHFLVMAVFQKSITGWSEKLIDIKVIKINLN